MTSGVNVSTEKVQEVLAGVGHSQSESQNLQTATTQKVQEVVDAVAVNDQVVRGTLFLSKVKLEDSIVSPEDLFKKMSEILKKLQCLSTDDPLVQTTTLQNSITFTNLQTQSQIDSTRKLLARLKPLVQQEVTTALTNTQSTIKLISIADDLTTSPPES